VADAAAQACQCQGGLQNCSMFERMHHFAGSKDVPCAKRPRTVQDIKLFIKTPLGDTVVLHVPQTATIKALKTAISASEGTPVDQQRLTHAGKQLEDLRTLSDYNIQTESTV
jgi:Ubiquitin family